MIKPCPNFYTDRKILHLGVCAQMSISIMNVFVTFRGLRFVSNIYWSKLSDELHKGGLVVIVSATDIHPKF